jgi:AraC-like DNA-binding protein
LLGLDFKPLSDAPFKATVQPIFQDLRIVRAAFSPGITFRDAELIKKDPDISFAVLIAQSGNKLSPRYVQRLLATSGISFTAHVTELRLKHAFMPLTAHCGNDRISDIALRAGFSDISHFNRLFRSRFGDTPKGVRANYKQCAPLTSKVPCSEPRGGNATAGRTH